MAKVLSNADSDQKTIAGPYDSDLSIEVGVHNSFLRNIGNWHWGTFAIDAETLLQRYYNSLHRTLDNDKREGYVISKLLHERLLDYYHSTMRVPHPKQKRWTRSIVTDSVTENHLAFRCIEIHATWIPILLGAYIESSGNICLADTYVNHNNSFFSRMSSEVSLNYIVRPVRRRLRKEYPCPPDSNMIYFMHPTGTCSSKHKQNKIQMVALAGDAGVNNGMARTATDQNKWFTDTLDQF